MISDEILNLLNGTGEKFYIIENKKYNPLEIVIITKKKGIRDRLSTALEDSYKGYSDICEKRISIHTLGDYGIKSWAKMWNRNGKKLGNDVIMLSEEDSVFFYLWFSFGGCTVQNWLSQNAIAEGKSDFKAESEEELLDKLINYIRDNGISLSISHIVNLPTRLFRVMSILGKLRYIFAQLFLRAGRKLNLFCLIVMGRCHDLFKKKAFIKHLVDLNVLNGKWEDLNPGRGSSSSTTIKLEKKGELFFIKGNELGVYNSINNEISAQVKLCKFYPDGQWYLRMIESGEGFIVYPFLNYKTLSDLRKRRDLDPEEIVKLGEFLNKVVDSLKDIELGHNDLRPGNILVSTDESGKVQTYMLIDFGCACSKGKSPWDTSYWGRYMAQSACGRYRYNAEVVDDAASAELVYIECGGDRNDDYSKALKNKIGGVFFEISK